MKIYEYVTNIIQKLYILKYKRNKQKKTNIIKKILNHHFKMLSLIHLKIN